MDEAFSGVHLDNLKENIRKHCMHLADRAYTANTGCVPGMHSTFSGSSVPSSYFMLMSDQRSQGGKLTVGGGK
jgi:hypothetical protein